MASTTPAPGTRASRGMNRRSARTITPKASATREARKPAAAATLTPEQQESLGSFPPPTPWSEQLAVENYRLAMHRANLFAARTQMPLEDLEIVAWVGLLNACRRWDPSRLNASGKPNAISTLAVPYIDGAMRRWLRDKAQTAGVKFPNQWRDRLPTASRLAAEGKPLAEIAAEIDMPLVDTQVMLYATGPSAPLPSDLASDADEVDGNEGQLELAALLDLTRRAVSAMHPSDQGLLVNWWGQPRRRSIPSTLGQQFRGRLAGLLRRRDRGQDGPQHSHRTPQQLGEVAVQLGLLDGEN